MLSTINIIKQLELELERETEEENQSEKLESLHRYKRIEDQLHTINTEVNEDEFREQQRVLAYCLMRQVNLLRQLKRVEEAEQLSEKEIQAARLSNDKLTLARSLMSHAITGIVSKRDTIAKNLETLDEAAQLFSSSDEHDFVQGLGWLSIIKADLINAKFIDGNMDDILQECDNAIRLLKPIENWVGVARAHEALSKMYEGMGDQEKSQIERNHQEYYMSKC